ncbi:hypothetical protein M5C72_00190 [Companilactobacillus allii]|uniref:Bacteriocin-associated integral membrane family protein n=1 Tax=Companilactobacillus allii TaxID=1847728 RepID=A0A1P8Q1D6_9LACO|nr:hypothetical protein [Companilactobacillus allii]APX71609.1 hypothetical protein BTM29_03130 [Companilactobacillus allii]USQ68691.1 hypothetical protein M5C72_00190 [Companilactobacillus allii]
MRVTKIFLVVIFLAGTIVSAFLVKQIELDGITKERYSIDRYYTPIKINDFSTNASDELNSGSLKPFMEKAAKDESVNLIFRSYNYVSGTNRDGSINYGKTLFNTYDYLYKTTEKTKLSDFYDLKKFKMNNKVVDFTTKDQKFHLYNMNNLGSHANGIFLIETKNKRDVNNFKTRLVSVTKANLKITNKDISTSIVLPKPELKLLGKYYKFLIFYAIFYIIQLVWWSIVKSKDIKVLKSEGITNFKIYNELIGYNFLITLISTFALLSFIVIKHFSFYFLLVECLIFLFCYIAGYISVSVIKLSNFEFSSSELGKFQKSEAYIILGIKIIISFAFLMMLFPIVKNVQYVFKQNHTTSNEYSNNTAVLYPMHVGDQIIDMTNRNEQAEEINSRRISRIVDKNEGQSFRVTSQSDGSQLITANYNYLKENPIRNTKNEIIKLPSSDKILILIPKSLELSSKKIKKDILGKHFDNVETAIINNVQNFKVDGKNEKFVNASMFIISSYNRTNDLFINEVNSPDGGGIEDAVRFPLKGKSTKVKYDKMLRDLQKNNLQYVHPTLVKLSEVSQVDREKVMGSVALYSTELISSFMFILLSSVISYSLLITSNKKKYMIKRVFGYSKLSTYLKFLIIPMLESLVLLMLSIKNLDFSIYTSIGFLMIINYLVLFTIIKIMDKKNIKELFSEV